MESSNLVFLSKGVLALKKAQQSAKTISSETNYIVKDN